MEALLGMLGGGLFRMAPEVLKFFDRKNERQHEKDMVGLNLEADKLKAKNQLDVIHAQSEATIAQADLEALIAGVQAQGKPTGIGWVDAMSALVRPIVTYWMLFLYSLVKVATFYLAVHGGVGYADAILGIWGQEDVAIFSSIIAFWFVDRSLRKGGGISSSH